MTGATALLAWFCGACAATYGAAAATLFWIQGRLIYPGEWRRHEPNEAGLADMSVVTATTADGLDLRGWYKAPASSRRLTVVLFHGNGEDLSQRGHIARALLDCGYGVYLAEYRGYGGNSGIPHEAGLYEDGRAALRFVERTNARIVLHGYSLGSGVAVQLAAEAQSPGQIEGLILEAPFTRIADVAAQVFWFMPVGLLVRDQYDNLAKIARVRVPVVIYGGTHDNVIPPQHFAHLYAHTAAPRRLFMLEGADHTNCWERGGGETVLRLLEDIEKASGTGR
ncbi:alpha/beta hydrolase [Paraburkholderia sp. EG304]|uniref:alpha/beta hydrolase n=1 Tax=Paraburkholderia sp. EG304 TaxID=3237015 RepID=UPI00397B6E8C